MPARLLMVGDGPDAAAAGRAARQLGVAGDVLFLGEQDTVVPLLSAADVFLLTSAQESFGLAALEAMACGVPVVASRVGGLPEVVDDGVTGFLVPIKSADGIQSTIQKLLESKTLRENISIKAKKAVAERFSIKQHVTKVEKIYNEIFSKH